LIIAKLEYSIFTTK